MRISLTRFRGEMFRLLPNLKDNEELTLTFEGEDAYIIKKTNQDRNKKFQDVLKKCPSINITDELLFDFINEGRR